MAEEVIGLALFGIGEDLVGFGDLFELVLALLGLAGVAIGMILLGQFFEGLFEIIRARVPRNAQHLVEILFSHDLLLPPAEALLLM
jgi:hypothetical protein